MTITDQSANTAACRPPRFALASALWGLVWGSSVAAQSVESGLWYDRVHAGHGLDLHRAGTTLFGAFYSYGTDGQTRWLWLQVDDLPDPSGDLWHVARVADGLSLSAVGRFSLRQTEVCADALSRPGARALRQFEFELEGTAQVWCVEPLLPADSHPLQTVDGAWYDPAEPGWGLFAHHYLRPDLQVWTYRSLYFHDVDGRPRWAFAQSAWSEADLTQRYYTPVAECLGCPPPVALTSEVGTARIHLQDVSPEPPAGSNPALIQLSLDGDDFLRETTLRLLSGPIQPSGE